MHFARMERVRQLQVVIGTGHLNQSLIHIESLNNFNGAARTTNYNRRHRSPLSQPNSQGQVRPMLENIHFYDTLSVGKPGLGQPVSFHSLFYENGKGRVNTPAISLRSDVSFMNEAVEQSPAFNTSFAQSINEYEWSRIAEGLFKTPNTLHIGIGNTSRQEDFLRYALYRCLSSMPSTDRSESSYYLDLITVLRATALLRPKTLPFIIPLHDSTAAISSLLFRFPTENRADAVKQIAQRIEEASPRLFSFALKNTTLQRLSDICGLVDGRVESLATLNPVFVTHDSLPGKKYGCFLTMGTDPQYPNILYMVDLQADLSTLMEEQNSFSQFINSRPEHSDRPIIRVNLNRSPFISPLAAVGALTAKRLKIDLRLATHNVGLLRQKEDLCLDLMEHTTIFERTHSADPDYQLYGPDYLPADKRILERLHTTGFENWRIELEKAHDPRIHKLGMRIISRFAPSLLNEEEKVNWDAHCARRLFEGLNRDRLEATESTCRKLIQDGHAPSGMLEAANHWIQTIGNRNELNR